jgi:hypothetical protein
VTQSGKTETLRIRITIFLGLHAVSFISSMFVIFYLKITLHDYKETGCNVPSKQRAPQEINLVKRKSRAGKIIRHGVRNGYNVDEYSDEATSHRQTTLRMTCGYAGNQ